MGPASDSHLAAQLTRSMKIRVNTVCPGIFPSEMTGTTSGSYTYDMPDAPTKAALRSTMREWLRTWALELTWTWSLHLASDPFDVDAGGWNIRLTAERPGKPEEIVAPLIMLSSRGGMYMNDALLTVDGGRLMVSACGGAYSVTAVS